MTRHRWSDRTCSRVHAPAGSPSARVRHVSGASGRLPAAALAAAMAVAGTTAAQCRTEEASADATPVRPRTPDAPNSGLGASPRVHEDAVMPPGHDSVTLPAFTHARGHGALTAGGRGGDVLIVDTREDVVDEGDGVTSLREALTVAVGPRTIVFAVGGLFDTSESMLVMSDEGDSHVTLACQSAPPPGVRIRGQGLRIRGGVHDLIFRHCTFRNIDPGAPDAEVSRAIGVIGTAAPSARMIFDHLSLSWATDENWTVFTGPDTKASSRGFTLSDSIVAEGDPDSAHPESGLLPRRYMHSMGPSCNSKSHRFPLLDCSIVGNLIAHNGRRNPLFWGASGEIVGNLVYNWYETAVDARPHNSRTLDVQILGNEFRTGPTTKRGSTPLQVIVDDGPVDVRVEGNIERPFVDGRIGPPRRMEAIRQGSPSAPTTSPSPINLDCVGASRPSRDAVDERIVAELENGTGTTGIGDDQERVYPYYPGTMHPPDYDLDRDGMADAWERKHGLDPTDPDDHRRDIDGDGYTALEEFVNAAATCPD